MSSEKKGSEMAVDKIQEEEALPLLPQSAGELFQQVISYYEDMVYRIALDLTGSESKSREVVETVTLQLYNSIAGALSEPIEKMVHRLTYQASIEKLLEVLAEKQAAEESDDPSSGLIH